MQVEGAERDKRDGRMKADDGVTAGSEKTPKELLAEFARFAFFPLTVSKW